MSNNGRREGSQFAGLSPVFFKEFADQLRSWRMRILEVLVLIAAVGAVFAAAQTMKATVAENPFAFLDLFTSAKQPMPSFVTFLGFFVPLVAISLGFDAINGEFSRRTMSRVLSQPIYRDALLMGKFLAAMATIAVVLLALWLVTTGLGIYVLGIPPGGEEVARGALFLLVTLFYAGIWLSIAMLFSIICHQPSTSAIASLGLWIFLTILWPIFGEYASQAIVGPVFTPMDQIKQVELSAALARLSPGTLYAEAVQVLLNPAVRSVGSVFYSQIQRALIGNPLHLTQSLVLVWPQVVSLLAGCCALFAASYISFQRREIRA